MGVCLRYAKTWEEAEDLLQEGFLKVFMDLKQFKGNGSFEGWIRKVIVNVALQHLRRKKEIFNTSTRITFENIPEESNEYEEIILQFSKEEMLRKLKQLPEGCQVIFNLYVMEELSHKEIAEKLDISVGTSKSQLSKARTLLKKSLNLASILI